MTTNDTPASVPAFDAGSWMERNFEFQKLCASIRTQNKTVLFDALAQAGIATILVEFDGYGDSGQIEDISAHSAPEVVAGLPEGNLEIARLETGSHEIYRQTLSVKDAIEQLAYDFVEETHGGWENNAGAFGDFIFDVSERTITLNYNERFEDSEYSEHVF